MATQYTNGIETVTVHGRRRYYSRLISLQTIDRNHFVAVFGHGTYKIEGGKPLGGSRHDWFIDGQPGAALQGTLDARGILDALDLLNGA